MWKKRIELERVLRFIDELRDKCYSDCSEMTVEYVNSNKKPIEYNDLPNYTFSGIKIGEKWAEVWNCAWFRMKGIIPTEFSDCKYGAYIDITGEGCVYLNGKPYMGLTAKSPAYHHEGKYYVDLDFLKPGEEFELLVDASANGLFGKQDTEFKLKKAHVVLLNEKFRKLYIDVFTLYHLAKSLDENSVQRKKLIYGLNEVCNVWNDGKGVDSALKVSASLLDSKANQSALDVYSVGHAHLDLAWLWPIRETKRKAVRTFTTALRNIEKFPDYVFGASQPQIYEWIFENQSHVFTEIQEAVKKGQWECQGGMWVEPDMNITGGESLVRQCIYGKQFYMEHFNVDVKNLWLPDVFGYSAALPQILRKCGIDTFMTQKISWNETNVFPYHTFYWKGIDNTRILTHFLPTNDYNLANMPDQLMKSAERFAQSDVSNEFLNLYGIGDGGGGPSELHIELGLRQRDMESIPKFKFAKGQDFFDKIHKIPEEKLPTWVGELYLELHRGTLTSQAYMKKLNRKLELVLRDIEILMVMSGYDRNVFKQEIDRVWKDTLMNQFHDILPGSSIPWVYKDAHKLSEENLQRLENIKETMLFNVIEKKKNSWTIINTLNWERKDVVQLKCRDKISGMNDEYGNEIEFYQNGDDVDCFVSIPALSAVSVFAIESKINKDENFRIIWNKGSIVTPFYKIDIDENGCLTSIFVKELNREILKGKANVLQLWEDKPNNWDAWDVNHYYRGTTPVNAVLENMEIVKHSEISIQIKQEFKVGQSRIHQIVELFTHKPGIVFHNKVDWREERKMLRVQAVPDIQAVNASYEIQYGTLERPAHNNTSWDETKFEVTGHRFADLSQADMGFALINDCKYGHYIKDNVMELTLLRSPQNPDPHADIGIHQFSYMYYPHAGDLNSSDVFKVAHNFNSALIVAEGIPEKNDSLKSLISLDSDNVKVEVIKYAESNSDIIIRMYEFKGTPVNAEMDIKIPYSKIVETDMMENELDNQELLDLKQLEFRKFEIKTFRISI